MIGQLLGQGLGTFGGGFLLTQGLGRGITPSVETRGGFDEHHYRAHRKHLERLTQIVSERDNKKYVKETIELAQELEGLAQTPEIDNLADKVSTKGTLRLRAINYDALQNEINLLKEYLDAIGILNKWILDEQDDELAFFLMMQ